MMLTRITKKILGLNIGRNFKREKSLTITTQHRKKDGSLIPVEVTVNYISQEGKEYACSFIRDLTERRAKEKEIWDTAKFPNENPNPVLRISSQGEILYRNKASESLMSCGLCPQGKPFVKNWHEDVREIFALGKPKEVEVTCEEKIYSLTFAPVAESNYLNVYGLDITERKKAEAALQKAHAEVGQLKDRLARENRYLQEEIKSNHNFEEIISRSDVFKEVLGKIEQVASTNSTVLILGETGTGKELISRAVHNISPRKKSSSCKSQLCGFTRKFN